MISSVEELKQSVENDDAPPEGTPETVKALWFARKGMWHEAHEVAQDIETKTGSWIHAHLHVVEGDLWNAGYWYSKAGKPESPPEKIPEEWEIIAEAVLAG